MSLERWFFGSVIYPAYHVLKRDSVLARMSEYESNQWLPKRDFTRICDLKLGALLRHARSHVPYYRYLTMQSGVAALDALSSMPRLTKADIRGAGERLLADNIPRRQLEANSTSGSTGEPLYFFTDRASSDCRKACVVRNRRWAGIELGDREMRLWGSKLDTERASRFRGQLHSWFTRMRMMNSFDLSPEALQAYVAGMVRYRPKLLIAYPSVLERLAAEVIRSGQSIESLAAIIVSAESLYPHQRDLFHRAFGRDVFNRYGSREVGDIAQECEAHDGMHINADRVVVEIVRQDGTACEAGEIGDVLVTDLDNFGMPLIRYAIGDRAAFSEAGSCRCGRTLPKLAEVAGRSMDVIRFPNNVAVGGTFWTFLLRERPGIEQFQVVQEADGSIVIRYVARSGTPEQSIHFVREEVLRRGGDAVRISFQQVDEIPLAAGGKRRLVVSHLLPESVR